MTVTAVGPIAAILAAATVAAILPVVAVVAAKALAMLRTPFVTHARTAVVIARTVVEARLPLLAAHGLRLRHRPEITAELLALLLTEIVAAQGPGLAERTGWPVAASVLHIAAALSNLLLAEGHDDAIVVLGVLQIVLSQNGIAARLRVTRKRQIFLCDVGWGSADFDVRPRAFEAPRQRILPPAVLIIIVIIVTAATSAVLLSLPHRLRSRWLCDEVILCLNSTSGEIPPANEQTGVTRPFLQTAPQLRFPRAELVC
jgi:hypothetical protein